MNGVYGSDPEDRHYERKLQDHLDMQLSCEICGDIVNENDLDVEQPDVLCAFCRESLTNKGV